MRQEEPGPVSGSRMARRGPRGDTPDTSRGKAKLQFHPLTQERWDDFVDLFGPTGATAGCWCMWWRRTQKEFAQGKGAGNRRAMRAIVDSGRIPGILAYDRGRPVGWCSVAPRKEFRRLDRSRILKRVDDAEVWSVVCFFIRKGYRRSGVGRGLLKAAVDHVRNQGGRIIEGYPVEPRTGGTPDLFAYTGVASMYLSAGFTEVARRSETRPVMRRVVRPRRGQSSSRCTGRARQADGNPR